MRASMIAGQVLDLITHHPMASAGVALAAAALSWLMTQTRGAV